MQRPIPPSESAVPRDWCRWAWLVSRQNTVEEQERQLLESIVREPTADPELQQTALSALWMTSPVTTAVVLEDSFVRHGHTDVALTGVLHPRWWSDAVWQEVAASWLGADDRLDAAIWMVWAWANRPSSVTRVPIEVLERAGLGDSRDLVWPQALEIGRERAKAEARTPFEGFWRQHVRDWVGRWLQWEQAVYLYRWRFAEEERLTRWTESAPYAVAVPPAPEILTIPLDTPMAPQESLYWVILGLGYVLGQDGLDLAPKWDAIWSSWASSLNYLTFEVQSNCQTTEWHIAGLTGALRDGSAMKRWGLTLE